MSDHPTSRRGRIANHPVRTRVEELLSGLRTTHRRKQRLTGRPDTWHISRCRSTIEGNAVTVVYTLGFR